MLPKTLYAKIEQDGDNAYMVAEWFPKDLIDVDDDDGTEIGEYKLVRKAKYTLQVKETN